MAQPGEKSVMNGRQRIKAAFNHAPVDRVPLFDQTVYSNVASAVLGRELLVGGTTLRFLDVVARFESRSAEQEFEEKMLADVVLFYRSLGYDMARIPWRDTRRAAARLDEYTYFFGDLNREEPWEIWRYSPESRDWHPVEDWLAGGNVERLCAHLEKAGCEWRGPDTDPSRLDTLKRFREAVGPDLALAHSLAGIYIPMWDPAWLMAVELAPELVGEELDRQVEQGLADLELAARIGVDVSFSGGDICLNSGPVFSPETFDRLVLPRLQRITARCDEVGIPYVYRTDGKTWPIADSLFGRSGVHAYGEVDFGAGMRLRELRERFPRLTLFGNMDCGGVLLTGTPGEVRRTVRENLDETGGIGHVFGASNAIMPETPPENYLAMLDEAARYIP